MRARRTATTTRRRTATTTSACVPPRHRTARSRRPCRRAVHVMPRSASRAARRLARGRIHRSTRSSPIVSKWTAQSSPSKQARGRAMPGEPSAVPRATILGAHRHRSPHPASRTHHCRPRPHPPAAPAPARAQVGSPHPLAGNWDVTDTQTGGGTAYSEISWNSTLELYTYATYISPGGTKIDSGTIVGVTGGYAFASSQGGGAGVIQHQSGTTYAWQNTKTGAGGTMTPH